jgi:translation initiation factor 1A
MVTSIGGKNYKKGKSGRKTNKNPNVDIAMDSGTEYFGVVTKIFGDRTIMVTLHDGTTAQALIPGKLFKRVWVAIGSFVKVRRDINSCELICRIDNPQEQKKVSKMMESKDTNDIFIVEEENDVNDENNINNIIMRAGDRAKQIKRAVNRQQEKEKDGRKRRGADDKSSESDSGSGSDSEEEEPTVMRQVNMIKPQKRIVNDSDSSGAENIDDI